MHIKCNKLSKRYLSSPMAYLKQWQKKGEEDFWALKDISFEIHHGERVGIIGRNGAGKSTLLNILSGYSTQTSGELDIDGKVTPVMEIGSSINAEATGRENIRDAARLSGIQAEKIEEKVQEVVDFVALGEYIDQPMKIYSSGMIAKVSFGCILFTEPEILVIDEVLGVGDMEFKVKSEEKTRELCQKGKILLMVSHSMSTIRKYTDRCIWIDKGRVVMDGPSGEVTAAFELAVKAEQEQHMLAQMEEETRNSVVDGAVCIRDMQVLGADGGNSAAITIHSDVRVVAELCGERQAENLDLIVECYSMRGYLLFRQSYSEKVGKALSVAKGQTLRLTLDIPDCNFNTGWYQVMLSVRDGNTLTARRTVLFRMVNDKYYNYLDSPQVYYRNRIKLLKLLKEEVTNESTEKQDTN